MIPNFFLQLVLTVVGGAVGGWVTLRATRRARSEALELEWLERAKHAFQDALDSEEALSAAGYASPPESHREALRVAARFAREAPSYMRGIRGYRVHLDFTGFQMKEHTAREWLSKNAVEPGNFNDYWEHRVAPRKHLQACLENVLAAIEALLDKPNERPWHRRIPSYFRHWRDRRKITRLRDLHGPGLDRRVGEAMEGTENRWINP